VSLTVPARRSVAAFASTLLALALATLAAPASGWAAGELTQKAGTAGCMTADGSEGCTSAAQVGRMAVISPDGEHVYTEAWEPRAAIQIFDRDPATGAVTPVPAAQGGCWQNSGMGGCQVLGILKPSGIAIDPDGENLYVSDFDGGEIISFEIDGDTGLLTRMTGVEGCMAWNADGVSCAKTPSAVLSFHLEVSPDGENLYALSQQGSGGVMTYDRDPDSGVLTVPVPSDGVCVNNDGTEAPGWGSGTCVDGRGLNVPEAIDIDDDGENVYIGSRERAVTVFDRNPTTGLLTQKAGVAGCWLASGATAQADCQEGEFIDGGGGRFGLDVAPDGKSVYVATGDSLAVFQRDTEDGELTQPSDEFGACVSSLGDPCFPSGSGMVGPQDVSVSPDNLQVYVATGAGANSGVAVFDRDPATSLLTQKLDKDGCHTQSGGGCTAARAMPTSTVLASPDGKNVYANRGDGAMAVFDRVASQDPPGPGPENPGGGGAGGGAGGGGTPTGGIGTQSATPSSPAPASGGRPRVGVQLIGRPQAGHYPYTASLLLTNYGRKDAVNSTARIDGFHTGAGVQVIGGGASGTVLDDGSSRSLLVTADRVPARSSKVVLARFTPVGPGHSFYRLHASLMRNSAPGGVPKLTETRSVVTRAVTSGAAANESGTVSLTNTAGTATIPYKLVQIASGPDRAETKYDETGGGLRVTVTAPRFAPASRPPTGSPTKRQGGVRLELSIDAAGLKVLGVDNSVWPMAGGIKLHYDKLIDCMQRHGMLTAADQKRLKAMYTHQVLALIHAGRLLQSSSAPLTPEDEAWASETVSIAGSALQSWEAHIVDAAEVDKAGGGKDKQKSIFIECSREERDEGNEDKSLREEEEWPAEEDPRKTLEIEVITPDDPNAKYGPRGAGKAGYIGPNQLMPYTIMFENKPTASAPAREVVVTDRLDASKLDVATFALGPVWFGDKVLSPPPGLRAWSASIDLRPAKPVIVTVDAKLDGSGLATWHFKTLDPATQLFPEDPFAGFLPANYPPPIGEGAVTFTVAQKRNLRTGTKISNAARIVFDKNEAIDTPVFTNTIDRNKPKVTLRTAKAFAPRSRKRGGACRVALSWKSADKGSGVGGYTVWVAERKEGEYRAVKRGYKRTKLPYKGKRGVRYRFRVVPVDRAGNVGKASKVLRASCPRR
jgi:DNA-binding beta-propeller fold protein YncE